MGLLKSTPMLGYFALFTHFEGSLIAQETYDLPIFEGRGSEGDVQHGTPPVCPPPTAYSTSEGQFVLGKETKEKVPPPIPNPKAFFQLTITIH